MCVSLLCEAFCGRIPYCVKPACWCVRFCEACCVWSFLCEPWPFKLASCEPFVMTIGVWIMLCVYEGCWVWTLFCVSMLHETCCMKHAVWYPSNGCSLLCEPAVWACCVSHLCKPVVWAFYVSLFLLCVNPPLCEPAVWACCVSLLRKPVPVVCETAVVWACSMSLLCEPVAWARVVVWYVKPVVCEVYAKCEVCMVVGESI